MVNLGRPIDRHGDVESPRGEGDRASARSAQALPAGAARADARLHLLGIPRPADHDRRGARPGDRPRLRAPLDRSCGLAGAAPRRVRRAGPGRDRDRRVDPRGAAARAVRRIAPARRVPDPGPDHVDHPHAVPPPRRPHRAGGCRLPHGVDADLDRCLASVHVDERGLAVVLRVVIPVGARRARVGVPRLPAVLEASPHHHERHQRVVREHPATRRARAAADRHGAGSSPANNRWAPRRCRISPARSCWTSTRAPNAVGAKASAPHGTRGNRSPRNC